MTPGREWPSPLARWRRRGRRRGPQIAFLLAAVFLGAGTSRGRAASQEEFGLGSRGAAMAGAMTSIADDFSSSFYNPAGSVLAAERKTCLGATVTSQQIEVTGRGSQGQDDLGVVFGMSFPIPLGGPLRDRIALATALVIPTGDTRLAKVYLPSLDTPFQLPYSTSMERVVVAPVLAIRLADWLAAGAGVSVFTFEAVNDATTNVGVTGGLEMVGDLYLQTDLVPRAGILLRPGDLLEAVPGLRIGAAYRGAFDQPFSLDSSLWIQGLAVDLEIRGHEMFAPEEFVLGASMEPRPDLTLSLDLAWERWSRFPSPRMTVKMGGLDALIPVPGLSEIAFEPAGPDLGDTLSPRLGAELRGIETLLGALTLRAGYRFEPSPGPASPADPLLFTNARHIAGAGLAIEPRIDLLDRAGFRPLVELHVQGHFLENETRTVPPELSKSGKPERVTAGGEVVTGGLAVSVGF